jgi:hypothetical protein
MLIRSFMILTYPGYIQHRGLLIQLRKGTAHNWRRRNRLAGAVGGGQQYHGCRDEWQQATHYAFQVSAGARMAIRCGRTMVVRCVCPAGGQCSPRLANPRCAPLFRTGARKGM